MENQAHQNELQSRAVECSRIPCPNKLFQKSLFVFADKHYALFLSGNFVRAFLCHRWGKSASLQLFFILLIKNSTSEVMLCCKIHNFHFQQKVKFWHDFNRYLTVKSKSVFVFLNSGLKEKNKSNSQIFEGLENVFKRCSLCLMSKFFDLYIVYQKVWRQNFF